MKKDKRIFICEGCSEGTPCIVIINNYQDDYGEPSCCCYGGGTKEFHEVFIDFEITETLKELSNE